MYTCWYRYHIYRAAYPERLISADHPKGLPETADLVIYYIYLLTSFTPSFQVGHTAYHLRLVTIHVPVIRRAAVIFTTYSTPTR
jgi:hypothetical protein